jgi:hypothetical protein
MKCLLSILVSVFVTAQAFAHDEGHGPKLGDQPKFGGLVSAVIDHLEVDKGRDAKLLYKAELTKNAQGTVRVYFYDNTMKPVSIGDFGSASADLIHKDRKTKKWISKSFKLEKKGDFYEGKLPLKPRPPFNVDVKVDSKAKKLFMAFDNLS